MGEPQSTDQPGPLIVILLTCCHWSCQTFPRANLQKAFSALVMFWKPCVDYSNQRPTSPVLEKKQSGCTEEVPKKLHCFQNGSPAKVTHLLQAQEATCPKQKGATAPGLWIRSHLNFIVVLIVLLGLVVALLVSLAAVSAGRRQTVASVTPDTPLLLACPHGWVGYNGICYFLSRDHLIWDQAKARCSEPNTSLAVLKDWEMEFLFHFSRNNDYWVGLHRQDQRLQWVDGRNFNSSFPSVPLLQMNWQEEEMMKKLMCGCLGWVFLSPSGAIPGIFLFLLHYMFLQ